MRISRKRAALFIVTFVTIVAIAALLIKTKPPPSTETREALPARVEGVIVTATELNPTRRFTGRIEPRYRSLMHFEVSGRVMTIHADTGTTVEQGDLLISIDPADYRDRLLEAETALLQEQKATSRDRELLVLAEMNVELAQKEVDRLGKLGTRLASQATLDNALQALSQQKSETLRLQHSLDTAEQRELSRQLAVDKARRELDRTGLRAPFDGIVSKRLVSPGDRVGTNTDAVQIIDRGNPELLIHVPTSIVASLSQGQQLALYHEDSELKGKLVSIQPDADEKTGTHAVRISVGKGDPVPGTVMQAEVPLGKVEKALTVPVSAILSDDGDDFLFVISDGSLEKRPVRLGLREDGVQVIINGAKDGEQVVARDVAALVDRQKVVVNGE